MKQNFTLALFTWVSLFLSVGLIQAQDIPEWQVKGKREQPWFADPALKDLVDPVKNYTEKRAHWLYSDFYQIKMDVNDDGLIDMLVGESAEYIGFSSVGIFDLYLQTNQKKYRHIVTLYPEGHPITANGALRISSNTLFLNQYDGSTSPTFITPIDGERNTALIQQFDKSIGLKQYFLYEKNRIFPSREERDSYLDSLGGEKVKIETMSLKDVSKKYNLLLFQDYPEYIKWVNLKKKDEPFKYKRLGPYYREKGEESSVDWEEIGKTRKRLKR